MRWGAASGLALAGVVLAACAASQPAVMRGTADSVQISYARGDVAATRAVAAQYCAQYERVAHFIEAELDIAYYDCDRRW